ncbi:hypothetical protein AB0395_27620 [Streptosporangium sp. NPDC051023]|uniref:hypothetical protein n=1 Tax=Streptosporangium sp. NPDC051023 TaxID=3155410 RepID=UPI00344C11F8
MTRQPFDCPFVFAVGLNTHPEEAAPAIEDFNRFYDTVHLGEVLAGNPGFVCAARYVLADPDPRGDLGPRWLAVYGVADEAAAQAFADRDAGARPAYSQGPPAWARAVPVWRMLWRRGESVGGSTAAPGRVALIGMDPAADASEDEVADFDAFYGGTHLTEILSGFGYTRGTCYELWQEFRHPAPGCPRHCAVYEADVPPPVPVSAALSPGPRAWEEREVRWRLKYDWIA